MRINCITWLNLPLSLLLIVSCSDDFRSGVTGPGDQTVIGFPDSHLENLIREIIRGLSDNLIVDIEPLVDNVGLGTGDELFLFGNPLSDARDPIIFPS